MAYALANAQYIHAGNGTSTGYYAVAAWQASHSYAAGALVRQATTPTVGNERVFACVTAGTSQGTEPTWVLTSKGQITSETTVKWIEVTGQPGVNGDISLGVGTAPNNSVVWTASNTPQLGLVIYEPTSGSLQVCTVSAAGSGTKPTFSATAGAVTSDGATAKWTSLGPTSAFTAVPWGAPHARTGNAAQSGWAQAGQINYIADTSAETQSTTIGWSFPGSQAAPSSLVCTPSTAAPPTGSSTGASITCTSVGGINVQSGGNSFFSVAGVAFVSTGGFQVATDAMNVVCYGCTFTVTGTSASDALNINSSVASVVAFYNCNVAMGSTSQSIVISAAKFIWKGGTLLAGLATPNSVFVVSGLSTGFIEAVDFTAMASGQQLVKSSAAGYFCLKDCAMASGTIVTAGGIFGGNVAVDAMRCAPAGTNYSVETHSGQGDELTYTTVIRTGGATDGATSVSHGAVTPAALGSLAFEGMPIDIWNAVTSTNRHVTMYGVANYPTMPNNEQVWFDVCYQGSGSSTLGTIASGNPNGLGITPSALTADTSAWDSAAPAWVASTTYPINSPVKASSNVGRVFFATVSNGVSAAGALPSGFASMADGATLADGSQVWRAGWRWTYTVTLSSPQPAQVGYLTIYPRYATPSMVNFLDPLVTLS